MKNLLPALKNEIVNYATTLCQDYLEFFNQVQMPQTPEAVREAFNNSPDDYLVGDGIVLDEAALSPEKMLADEYELTLDQLWDFLCNLKFTKKATSTIYYLCKEGLKACFRSPTQESLDNFAKNLPNAIDINFPPPPKLSQNLSVFAPKNKPNDQRKPPVAHPPMERNEVNTHIVGCAIPVSV